jgi:hypothetical protein
MVRLRRILDEHQRKQELVSTAQTAIRIPRDAMGARASGTWICQNRSHVFRAIDPRSLRDLARHVREVGPHPEDGERHEQADEWQDDRKPGVQDPDLAGEEVERRDDPFERQRQSEDEEQQQEPGAGDPQQPIAKPAMVEITSEIGTTAEDDENA